MKYGIVMPRFTDNFEEGYIFPIGMAYVSSSLKQTGREVFTYNLNYKYGTVRELVQGWVLEKQLDVLATGGLTAQYGVLKEILDAAREVKPNIILLVGGGGITASPVPMMEALEIADYGMIGEGEITICELAEALEGKRTVDSVDGLVYKKEDVWTVTEPRKEIMDLDSIPYPDYKGFDYDMLLSKPFSEVAGAVKERCGFISLSRSCPFSCTFCFHPSGSKYRRRSMESAFQEIDFLIQEYNIQNLYLSDELFLTNVEDARRFGEGMKKRNLGFAISMRVDRINREFLEVLRDSGCFVIMFGLESADNRILKSMNKRITVEQIESALTLCNEVGIKAQGNFIFGDEAETMETAGNTIQWWKEHPEFSIRTALVILYPGSQIYQNACKRGIIKDEVEFIKAGCPIINASSMTDQEYRDMAMMISTETQGGTKLLEDAAYQYSGKGKIDYTGRCPKCGMLNTWRHVEPFRSPSNYICEECGESLHIIPSESLSKYAAANFRYLSPYKIAVWAMTNMIGKMCEAVPEIMNDNVYFVDAAKMKQGGHFRDKIIYAPEIIREKEIEVVLIATSSLIAHGIIRQIREFPSVKYFCYAGELFDPKFGENLTDLGRR